MKLLIVVAFLAVVVCCGAFTCRPCVKDKQCTTVPTNCEHGIVKDVCGCCDVCGHGPGEDCGGSIRPFGNCGDKLTCVPDKVSRVNPGKCTIPPTRA